MPKVYEPIKIGTMVAPNRFSYEPIASQCCDPRGYVNDRILEQYRRIAAGGYGLFHTGAVAVHPQGQMLRPQLALWDESYIDGLHDLAEAIKREGPRAGIQLFHGGIIANPRNMVSLPPEKRIPLGPSPVPADPRAIYHGQACREMSVAEIEESLQAFATAASWAKEAGFEFVQLHACHQSLPMQFLSPKWNRRTDEWGENRLLYIERVYQAMRAAVGPDFPLTIRVSATEMPRPGEPDPGYTEQYFYEVIAPAIEKMGWAELDVSAGGHALPWSQVGMGMPLYTDQAWAVRFALYISFDI
jgi:2,4-dienoyl-CoA reductase-like NADH-dependent reductase (Old Yellow Enzyme family)